MIGDFFYTGRDSRSSDSHVITDEHIGIIRKLRFDMKSSYYYNPMPVCLEEENHELLSGIAISDIWKSAQFLTMTATCEGMSPLFESLLRSLYIDEYNDGGFAPGYKRPFGNSDVLSDVRWEMFEHGCYGDIHEEELEETECGDIEQQMLESFMSWLVDDFFKNFRPRYRAFRFAGNGRRFNEEGDSHWRALGIEKVHSNLCGWVLDASETREIKLNEIGI